jgi:hypothetical protein
MGSRCLLSGLRPRLVAARLQSRQCRDHSSDQGSSHCSLGRMPLYARHTQDLGEKINKYTQIYTFLIYSCHTMQIWLIGPIQLPILAAHEGTKSSKGETILSSVQRFKRLE